MDKIAYKYANLFFDTDIALDKVIKESDIVIYDNKIKLIIIDHINNNVALGLDINESIKNLDTFEYICKFLLDHNVNKKNRIVAIGGGVLLDLCSFVASSYMRGIGLISIPTTLLAMVDASVGGKCGVNFHDKKNYIGAFYHPKEIYIFTSFLKTLSEEEISNGMAEVIKIALVSDKKFFSELKGEVELEHLIRRSIELKISFIEDDVFDQNKRQILNFGHTIGHALESTLNYQIKHGFCVAIAISYIMNNNCVDAVLQKYKLKTRADFNLILHKSEIINLIKYDKKNNENIKFVIVNEIGKGELIDVSNINTIVKW